MTPPRRLPIASSWRFSISVTARVETVLTFDLAALNASVRLWSKGVSASAVWGALSEDETRQLLPYTHMSQRKATRTDLRQDRVCLALEIIDDILGGAHCVALVYRGGLGEGKNRRSHEDHKEGDNAREMHGWKAGVRRSRLG